MISTRASRICLAVMVALAACSKGTTPDNSAADATGHVAPSEVTARRNAAVLDQLPFADDSDFANATRGRLGGDGPVVVRGTDDSTIWNTPAYSFVTGEPPASVNPSLWRQSRLTEIHGLFEVAKGIYQVRGYDLSNMSLIAGESGWIVVDPLTAEETAAAAFALVREQLGDRPVSAVIFTHSHVDHFGGIAGVLSADEARQRSVPIVAPAGFLEEATSENVLAGIAMGRRATYMYGMGLERSPRGHVGSGLGLEPARGRTGILPPTESIDHTPQEKTIDGVRFIFQYAPESEAPAELTFYLPDHKAYCGAEIVTHTLHNLYTLRGAKVRDALKWSGYIDEALRLFGDVEVVFASHHWPTWGHERVVDYMEKQRDTYKYIHDQTLRLANSGMTPREIAETIEFPPTLRENFAGRDYYGTLRHNAKAVYQWYFGWYDGNPAHLDPLPPADSAPRYVALMGGADEVLRKAQEAFDTGEYRWSAEILDHLVFAEPTNTAARELLARTYDQLGYQAESGPWRDVYLTGADELRHGVTERGVDLSKALGLLRHIPTARFFDSMAARLDGPKAAGEEVTINFVFTDVGETHVVRVKNAVLHHNAEPAANDAAATVRLTKEFLLRLAIGQAGLREMIFSDDLEVDGSRLALLGFFRLLDTPNAQFPIVTP